jgi:hypothetical protein
MSIEFINAKGLAARIIEVKDELAKLLHLESFLTPKPKRGRPMRSVMTDKPVAKKGRKGKKRGNLSATILKYLSAKGKEGAHVRDIAAHVGTKPANVTAWTYTTGKSKVKKVKPATFALA